MIPQIKTTLLPSLAAFVLTCVSTHSANAVVQVYQNCNYGGATYDFAVGRYTMSQLSSVGIANDSISSVRVNSGYRIILYADNNFAGASLTLTSSSSCLTSNSFNDLASSIAIESTGSCPQWQSGTWYTTGTTVVYNGSYYTAEHDNPGYDPSVSTWYWEPASSCSGTTPPSGGTGFSAIVSEAQFNQMFPNRNPFYTYTGLVNAAATYTAFCGTGTTVQKKREAAAALANFAHETGGLVYIEEIARGAYCSGSSTPCGVCASGKNYYGRGPIQISWNYNYCTAGQALGLDLWANPDQVAQNATTAWKTALWFWMTQTSGTGTTCHSAILNGSFSGTIRTINGSECNGGNSSAVQSRVNYYRTFCTILGVDPGTDLNC